MPYTISGREINPYQPSYTPYDLSPEEEQLLQWALSRDVAPDALTAPGAAFDPNVAHDQFLPAEYAMSRGANARDMYSRALESKTRSEAEYEKERARALQLEDEQRKLDTARSLAQEENQAKLQSDLTTDVLKATLEPTKPGEIRSPMLANVKTPQDAIKLVESYLSQYKQPTVTPQAQLGSKVVKTASGVYKNVFEAPGESSNKPKPGFGASVKERQLQQELDAMKKAATVGSASEVPTGRQVVSDYVSNPKAVAVSKGATNAALESLPLLDAFKLLEKAYNKPLDQLTMEDFIKAMASPSAPLYKPFAAIFGNK